jgi:hypothetical protein
MTNGLKKIRRAAALGFRPSITLASQLRGDDVIAYADGEMWIPTVLIVSEADTAGLASVAPVIGILPLSKGQSPTIDGKVSSTGTLCNHLGTAGVPTRVASGLGCTHAQGASARC